MGIAPVPDEETGETEETIEVDYSEMSQSPDHLIFLSTLVHLQKMIYIYLCYEFGLSMKLEENEKLKIWPTNINISMPKMVTKKKDISQRKCKKKVSPNVGERNT